MQSVYRLIAGLNLTGKHLSYSKEEWSIYSDGTDEAQAGYNSVSCCYNNTMYCFKLH